MTQARKGVVRRATKGDLDRITAYLPVALGERLRVEAARTRQDMSAIIARALDDDLPAARPRGEPAQGRGRGVVRSTGGRTTIAKQLRIDAELIQRYEVAAADGQAPVLTRLVERLLRDWLVTKATLAAERRDESDVPRGGDAMTQRRSGNLSQAYKRADGVETRATTVHLPVELHRALKRYAAETDEKLSAIMVRALDAAIGAELRDDGDDGDGLGECDCCGDSPVKLQHVETSAFGETYVCRACQAEGARY